MKRKFQILNEYKSPLPLMGAEKIIFHFDTDGVGPMEKSSVEILDHAKGIVEVELSDFEIQGLSEGINDCGCKILMQNADEYTVLFSKAISVQIIDNRKVWL